MKKQNRLIGKLRDECKRQAAQIEKLVKKNRSVSLCIYMLSYHIQYNLVRTTICPARFWHYNEFGDKLSKDRKPKVNSDFKFGMTDGLPEMSIITCNLNFNI